MTKFHCQERPNSLSILTLIFGEGKSHQRPSPAAATHFLCKHKTPASTRALHSSLGVTILRGAALPQVVTEGTVVGRGAPDPP